MIFNIKNVYIEEKDNSIKVYHNNVLKVVKKIEEGIFFNDTEISSGGFFDVMKALVSDTGSGATEQPVRDKLRVRYVLPSIKNLEKTVYKTEYYAKGESVKTYPQLPEIPDSRVEFDCYTHALHELSNLQHDIDVGVVLKPVGGKTHIDFTLTPVTGLSASISFQISGGATFRIHWGDDSYSDFSANNTASHNYSNYGDHTITIERISGTGTFTFNSNFCNVQAAITNIYLANNVSFGSYTFASCLALRGIVIPTGITAIGSNAFKGCNVLRSVVIPDSVTTIEDYAFTECWNLQSFVMSNKVSTINSVAFSNCTALQSIVLSNAITKINDYTFDGCQSLQYMVIPNNVKTIGNVAFAKCFALSSVVIPESVTTIGDYAFSNCISLYSYTVLKDTPPTISTVAFTMMALTKIYVPDASAGTYKTASNWLSIANYIYKLSEKN